MHFTHEGVCLSVSNRDACTRNLCVWGSQLYACHQFKYLQQVFESFCLCSFLTCLSLPR